MKHKSMGGHQSANARTVEWLTPPEIKAPLGEFDLDPCSPVVRPWPTAKTHYTKEDNGLVLPWFGRVWLNPPYGREIVHWMARMAQHGDGIALIFARTDTRFFQEHVFGPRAADSILFLDGRIFFCNTAGIRAGGNGGAPSCLIAYGLDNVERLGDSGLRGKHLLINVVPTLVVGVSPSWKAVVGIALTRLGGEADLEAIYELVERVAPDKLATNGHFREKVRQVLQVHFDRVRRGRYTLKLEA
jgi:DNA N-6-adenine-methyltransferase Dam